MPFRPAIVKAGADHLLFVVHPREKDWCVTGYSPRGRGFELRADLPAAWAGLTNRDLEATCGVEGATLLPQRPLYRRRQDPRGRVGHGGVGSAEAVAVGSGQTDGAEVA